MSGTPPVSGLQTLVGGVEIQVTSHDGVSVSSVTVRQLRIKDFPAVARLLDDEPALAAFFCSKPTEWADTISDGSIEAITEKGWAINRDPFLRWASRRKEVAMMVMPNMPPPPANAPQ